MSSPFLPDHNEIILNRYDKAERLRTEGINPFVNIFRPTETILSITKDLDRFISSGSMVRLAGRVLSIRRQGKACFFHIQDSTGRIQVYLKMGEVDEIGYRLYKESLMDTGDIVGVEGTVFRTHTNEITIVAKKLELLTKSMRPLPSEWYGLKDQEIRYQKRYLDLIMNEYVRNTFVQRTRIISAIREYMNQWHYMEVETPMMQPVYGGAAARPFTTHHNAMDMDLYLRIAPELYLKRLVVGGFEKVYEINRNFRNEGISTRHNPEFTMMEAYTAYVDYTDSMRIIESLLSEVCYKATEKRKVPYGEVELDFNPPFKKIRLVDLIKEELGLDLDWSRPTEETRKIVLDFLANSVPDLELREQLIKEVSNKTNDEIIILLFEELIEKTLIQPTFVMDYPKTLCPLAKSKIDRPDVVERFEMFICGMELANAYTELNDPKDQYERFASQVEKRKGGDIETESMDEDYIMALEHGMPPTSGFGIGIDRLVMLLTNSASIRDVILFPLRHSQKNDQ